MNTYKQFETERLILQPIAETDGALILKLFNTPKWVQYIGDRNVRTVEQAREYIRTNMLPQQERLGFASYTLIRKTDGVKVGMCGLYDRTGLQGIDIGFALLPEYEQKGYGYEAAERLKNAAFTEFGIREILAITVKDNLSSQKLLEKLGLECIGTTTLPGDEEELLLYRLKND